jgi:protein-ribulosamine 3-kinase
MGDFLDIPEFSADIVHPLCGGDTCQSFLMVTKDGEELFCKQTTTYPGMLCAEAKGLELMGSVRGVKVPKVRACTETSLVLDYIRPNQGSTNMASLGRGLAALHKKKSDTYGLPFDNFCGRSIQKNLPELSADSPFADFFLENRLHYQVKLAADKGRDITAISAALNRATTSIRTRLEAADEVGEGASLLHGDLWGKNVCHGYFIDPAVYYGHRETDLAMTRLFGGFDKSFYQAYEESYPTLDGYAEREPIYQLYHILNHYTIFGGDYGREAESTLCKLAG